MLFRSVEVADPGRAQLGSRSAPRHAVDHHDVVRGPGDDEAAGGPVAVAPLPGVEQQGRAVRVQRERARVVVRVRDAVPLPGPDAVEGLVRQRLKRAAPAGPAEDASLVSNGHRDEANVGAWMRSTAWQTSAGRRSPFVQRLSEEFPSVLP